jgi:isopenicillin-N N-acyltransferase-like protein
MEACINRRDFLQRSAAGGAALAGVGLARETFAADSPPEAPDHALTIISGQPVERGRAYGEKFGEAIRAFLDREIYASFAGKTATKDELLRYADQCGKAIREYSPEIADELDGLAAGAGLRQEEAVLITLHEELWHRGVLPHVEHCTAIAVGPPDTNDGHAYVGQNWDWMQSVYGLSSMLLWKRPEGASVLAYSYPGLWAGAGLNSAGIALCWTSAQGLEIPGPRVGIPSYVLIAQMLYQESLSAAIEEARRAKNAGWFTFVLADGEGQLANVEGSPEELAVELNRGHLARVYYGSRQMTRTPEPKTIERHPQCRRMLDLLEGSRGRLDRARLQGFFGDHESTICKHYGTLDSMLFDTTARQAHVSRGPGCSGRWQTFSFEDA